MKRKRTIEEIRPILEKTKQLIIEKYKEDVEAIILYGSFAKGIADEDSDIDIALVLKSKVNKSKEIDRIYDFLYDLELESGELISVKPLSREELEDTEWPLYFHIKNEGINV
ncbi:TPA: nucleotidyltransferase [bacterium]|nr:nucleotidyltransferase [bacterium]